MTSAEWDLLNVNLNKWPAMVVRGERVTPEQAMEIIIRTDGWWFLTNDKEWLGQIEEAAGVEKEPRYDDPDRLKKYDKWHDSREAFRNEIGMLHLEYLTNSRIASSWVGGPKGWCHWSGKIGSDNYNIGKWPTVEAVLKEWETVAREFPFLKLTCVLFDGENCEIGIKPLVGFLVEGGDARLFDPSEATDMYPDNNLEEDVKSLFTPGRERGCSLETLQKAIEYVRNKRNAGK